MDHNRWHGVGRLVRNPEYFPPGRRSQEHCTFSLAINRVVPNGEGPAADFIPCSVWGEKAREFAERVQKGDEVTCLGRIRTNLIPQADGSKKFFWEARVDTVIYGRISLKNLRTKTHEDSTTRAVKQLTEEFGE